LEFPADPEKGLAASIGWPECLSGPRWLKNLKEEGYWNVCDCE